MKILITTISFLTFFISNKFELPKNFFEPTTSVFEKTGNDDFSGIWINVDKKTRGVAKCEITFLESQYTVQMWGSCVPQDCDMGKINTDGIEEGASKFELLWDSHFAESFITYELVDGKLQMTNKRSYKDNSGRQAFTIVEYFRKQ